MDTKTRSLIDTFARNAIHLHGVTVVAAAESKDTGAPYTHKRYLKSLDGTRFMYVAVAINQLNNEFIRLVDFGRDAKEMSTKDRSTWITKARHRLGELGEVFERIDNIGLSTISFYSGVIINVTYKMSRFVDSQWDGNAGAWLNYLDLTSTRNNVVKDIRSIQKEAKERGITDHKIEALAETCKLSSTGYSMKRASVVGSSVVAAEKPTINVHSRELLAVVEFVSYLGDLGCLKDMVLHSVAGNAWTKLHKIPKPVLTAFDDALKTYKYIKGKKSKDGTRYVVTPVGESLLRRTPAYTSAKASVAMASDYTNIDLQDAYKEFRSVMTSPTVGEAIKKLWKFGVKAVSWYMDAQGGPVAIGDAIAAILEFEGELKEFGAKVKKLGVGQKTYNIMFKFLEADKKAFNEFRKTQKARASVATAKGSSKKWMQDVSKSMEESGSKGSLHRYFKIPEDETIPMQLLKDTLKKPNISEKTRKRIQLAITFKQYAKTKGRKATAAAKPTVPPLTKWKLTSAGNGDHLKYVWAVKPGRNFIEMYAIGSEWRVVINHMDVVPGFEFLKAKTSTYGTALYVRREHGELYLSPAAYPFSSPEEALKALKLALANEAAEQAKA